ncbi:MAG: mandelate racemase/muconate lactonizing enzyme family protein [Rhodobacteraceae bacterium]|nr:mandelate racemase/muconate lactonizing enzyme family protein [Paracoccaceae bacterium]
MSQWPEYREARSSWLWPSKRTFVRVQTDDGLEGWGITNGGEVTELIVNHHLGPLITGQSAEDIEDLWERMFRSLLPVDRSGFTMMAIAAVDIALWDLRCQRAGKSLTEILGGTRRDSLHAYATTVRPSHHSGAPWWGLKAAAPYGPSCDEKSLDHNVSLMRDFRAVVGDTHPIMIDAFMAWDADYTLAFFDKAQELGVFWIEDPVPPQDLRALEAVKIGLDGRTKLALGNFASHRWECDTLLREGLVDILQPDVCWAGGITETLRIFDLADAANAPVILHNTCEQPWAIALAAVKQKIPVVEFVDRGDRSPLYDPMGPAAIFEAGKLILSNHVPAPRADLRAACRSQWGEDHAIERISNGLS